MFKFFYSSYYHEKSPLGKVIVRFFSLFNIKALSFITNLLIVRIFSNAIVRLMNFKNSIYGSVITFDQHEEIIGGTYSLPVAIMLRLFIQNIQSTFIRVDIIFYKYIISVTWLAVVLTIIRYSILLTSPSSREYLFGPLELGFLEIISDIFLILNHHFSLIERMGRAGITLYGKNPQEGIILSFFEILRYLGAYFWKEIFGDIDQLWCRVYIVITRILQLGLYVLPALALLRGTGKNKDLENRLRNTGSFLYLSTDYFVRYISVQIQGQVSNIELEDKGKDNVAYFFRHIKDTALVTIGGLVGQMGQYTSSIMKRIEHVGSALKFTVFSAPIIIFASRVLSLVYPIPVKYELLFIYFLLMRMIFQCSLSAYLQTRYRQAARHIIFLIGVVLFSLIIKKIKIMSFSEVLLVYGTFYLILGLLNVSVYCVLKNKDSKFQ